MKKFLLTTTAAPAATVVAALAATTAIVLPPGAAWAQAVNGVYVNLGAGVNFMQDTTLPSARIARTEVGLGKTRLRFDDGYRLLGAVGYGFGNGLRVEVEGDYFNNGVSRVGRNATGSVFQTAFNNAFAPYPGSVTGTREKFGGFVNALYDIDLAGFGLVSPAFPVTPYVGVGVGYLQSKNQNLNISTNVSGVNTLVRSTGEDGNFAYQAILGAAFPITAVPGLAITGEYRFTGMADDLTYKGQFFAPGVATRIRLREEDNYNHSLMLGVRYAFNTAPPPPPPAPVPMARQGAPEAARTYLVFFDWDRADLTARARQIIAEAAQASQRAQVTRIEVSGHTDSSGTARYNQALSLRRANNVAGELVRQGVPRGAIQVQGFGESRPLVPTAQGVREPQNRRVEIVLR